MFWDKKEEENLSKQEGKITERDIGFAEDAFNLAKNLVSMETHCLFSYISTEDEEWLNLLKEIREDRTDLLEEISDKNTKGHSWCLAKHTCEKAMIAQELCTRCLSIGDITRAKKYAQRFGKYYLRFLKFAGYDEKNIKNDSSA